MDNSGLLSGKLFDLRRAAKFLYNSTNYAGSETGAGVPAGAGEDVASGAGGAVAGNGADPGNGSPSTDEELGRMTVAVELRTLNCVLLEKTL